MHDFHDVGAREVMDFGHIVNADKVGRFERCKLQGAQGIVGVTGQFHDASCCRTLKLY
jgi:hypothetical protein